MKSRYYFLLLCLVHFACGNGSQSQDSNIESEPEVETQEISDSEVGPSQPDILGYYVGDFDAVTFNSGGSYTNKITIVMDAIDGDQVRGRSIVAGNYRPFKGTYDSGTQKVVAEEPGDDRYDGVFKFTILTGGEKIEGKWFANDKNLKVPEREYTLEKKTFSYDKNIDLPEHIGWSDLYNASDFYSDSDEAEFLTEAVIKLNPSNTELTKEDVENMYKGDLEVIRNSIYARHGYSFKNRKMRYVFDRIDWYIPVSTDIRNDLTVLEVKNIDLIKRYEQHAEAYYDSFGR